MITATMATINCAFNQHRRVKAEAPSDQGQGWSALPPTLPGCPTGPACRCLRPRLGRLPSRVCTYLARLPKKYGRWCVVPAAHDLWTGRLQGDNLISHVPEHVPYAPERWTNQCRRRHRHLLLQRTGGEGVRLWMGARRPLARWTLQWMVVAGRRRLLLQLRRL